MRGDGAYRTRQLQNKDAFISHGTICQDIYNNKNAWN